MQRLYIYASLAAAMIATAAAQEAPPALTDLAACRIDDAQIRLSFKFESSPCWETTDPVIADGTGSPPGASVAIGTVSTADICTMNIVIAEFDQALAIAAPINAVEVTLTTPEGAPIGAGTAAVAEPGPDCTAPAETAASN